jgi:hypothetical protein
MKIVYESVRESQTSWFGKCGNSNLGIVFISKTDPSRIEYFDLFSEDSKQDYFWVCSAFEVALQEFKSITNPKELGLALKGLDGETFKVLELNRNIQQKTESIKNLHLISHISYKYVGDNCTFITLLQQSLNIRSFSGTFIDKNELNKLSTKASSYDPLAKENDLTTQNVSGPSTSNETYPVFTTKDKKKIKKIPALKSHKKIIRKSKFKPTAFFLFNM